MKIVPKLLMALALVPALAWAQAGITRGQTDRGEPFLLGGVGEDQVAALRLAQGGYGLSVRTAARGTGAWLADVHLRIEDAQGQPVFDRDLTGPWLLVGLQPGRYVLRASRGNDVQAANVTVSAGKTHEQMFYFDVPEPRPEDPVRFPPAAR